MDIDAQAYALIDELAPHIQNETDLAALLASFEPGEIRDEVERKIRLIWGEKPCPSSSKTN